MQAHESPFGFLRNQSRYKIPYFQRAYVWDEDNWKDLLDDLLDANSSHFLGSIILKNVPTSSGKVPVWSITDGQQRLTTLSILFRACCDAILSNPENAQFKDEIDKEIKNLLFYTENKLGAKPEIKILHSRIDAESYRNVITGQCADKISEIRLKGECTDTEKPSGKIERCYKYFYTELINRDTATDVYEFLIDDSKNIIVKIDLDASENEQAIFDTVNSAGVRLTCADIIKNALFQKATDSDCSEAEKKEIENLYVENWEKIFLLDDDAIDFWSTEKKEGRLKKDNLEVLLSSIALIKGFFDPYKHKSSELVMVYKEYIKGCGDSALKLFIKEIAEYAQVYRKWFDKPEGTIYHEYSKNIHRVLHILDTIDVSTLHPYILKLLKEYKVEDDTNQDAEFAAKMLKLESLVIRYVACDASTSNFNKVCSLLISGKTTIEDQYKEKVDDIGDEVVKKKLASITTNKNAMLILFWMELKDRFDDSKCSTKGLAYSYTLEHIMPQKWGTYWPIDEDGIDVSKLPGDSTEEKIKAKEEEISKLKKIRESAVYEIGNMTLLNGRLNATISNYDILRKINGEGKKKGIKDYSDLFVTKEFLTRYEKAGAWSEKQISERTEHLLNKFFKQWPI